MNAASHIYELGVDTLVADGHAAVVITIDGVDVLSLDTGSRRPDGTIGPTRFMPPMPVDLLPPDSSALLPTTVPRQAMLGRCECGEPGCSSLWVQVRRDGGTVVWEPDPNTPRWTTDRSWAFELRQYLDAVDAGQRSIQAWETQPMRVAGELRGRRDSLFGHPMYDVAADTPLRLLDAFAFPTGDEIFLHVVGTAGPRQLTVHLDGNRSDAHHLQALSVIEPGLDEPTIGEQPDAPPEWDG